MKGINIISIFLLFQACCFTQVNAEIDTTFIANPEKLSKQEENLGEKIYMLEKELAVLKKGDENIISTVETWKWITGWVTGTVLSIVTILLVVSWINARRIAREQAKEEVRAISGELLGQLKAIVQEGVEILDQIKREKGNS